MHLLNNNKNSMCVWAGVYSMFSSYLAWKDLQYIQKQKPTAKQKTKVVLGREQTCIDAFFSRAHINLLFTFQGVHHQQQVHSDVWQKRSCQSFLPFYSHLIVRHINGCLMNHWKFSLKDEPCFSFAVFGWISADSMALHASEPSWYLYQQ